MFFDVNPEEKELVNLPTVSSMKSYYRKKISVELRVQE
jgi:hypothetical protein